MRHHSLASGHGEAQGPLAQDAGTCDPGRLEDYAGPPRSLMWRGGAVHLRSPVVGHAPDPHAHFAIQLSIAVGMQSITFRPGPRTAARRASAWVCSSDQPHFMSSTGVVVTFFWDPVSASGRRLTAGLAGRPHLALDETEGLAMRRHLQELWRTGWTQSALHAAADAFVDRLVPADAVPAALDPRVHRVLEAMADESAENTALGELARRVGVSESRLAHLFRASVGLPVRQYRLTLRMEDAVRRITDGASLTEAAHAAGFSDSAHFCRTCRRMFGMAPSALPAFEAEEAEP